MDGTAVRTRAGDLPREPGVYQFLSDDDVVLYVGKAVELRDRVRSYADPRSARIRRMVDRATTVDYAVTDTETQALLLEANLIKRHQPRYNVRLKDDKSYPLVQLTDHEFPRIEITRDPNEAATVYGPYTDKGRVEVVVKALRETYGVRGCSDHKFSNRERPCLDYDIGLCTAPCTGEIGEAGYLADVESVERFFEGETGVLADPLRREMEAASQDQQFERAANLRDRLAAVEAFHGGASAAVSDSGGGGGERAVDVLGVAVEGERATVARLRSERGQLVDRERHTMDVPDTDEPVAGVLSAFVPQYYAERELPDALLLPERPEDGEVTTWLEREGVAVRVPGAGREATLVDLALKNARRAVGGRDEGSDLADALSVTFPDLGRVERIEGFDVSHAQGKAVVGSNVVFVGGSPEKGDYRRKKLTERNDDYANMRELVGWRAIRAIEGRDDRPDPDLLLVDGGEGQLEAARDALDEVGWDVPAIGLAKREERVITHDGGFDWPSDAPHLHLLQRVRDEAHRFAVQYHQQVRDEVRTVLDDVSGIGPETRRRLLRRFGSVENVRAASVEDLTSVTGVGAKTAETLKRRL
ncbi:excinuclease ABC subunit C [Halomarina litorea]|uniref:excinuclease ABC subunit C n=1 Tax=Halomarina litorea TaxID=2961595 RepID=UPI0020C213E2|nr:excinuclease ABC subunit C [Halomarina sp. BCD28]